MHGSSRGSRGSEGPAIPMSDMGSSAAAQLLGETRIQPLPRVQLSRVGDFHPGVKTCMNTVLAILSFAFVGILVSLAYMINNIASLEETEANKARLRDGLYPLAATDGAILLVLFMMTGASQFLSMRDRQTNKPHFFN